MIVRDCGLQDNGKLFLCWAGKYSSSVIQSDSSNRNRILLSSYKPGFEQSLEGILEKHCLYITVFKEDVWFERKAKPAFELS